MADNSQSGSTGGINPPGVSEEIQMNLPRKGAKDQYLYRCFNSIDLYHRYIASADFSKPLRLKVYVRNCLSMVADDVQRNRMLDSFEDACDYVSRYSKLDATDRTDLLLEVATCAIGEFTSWLDEFVGISRQNALVPLVSLPDPRVQEAVEDILSECEKGEPEAGFPME